MARACWLALTACLAANLARALSSVPSQNMEFTYLLPAGSRECFFQSVEKDSRLEFEYQVIGQPNLDVGFVMISPSGDREIDDKRKNHAIHKLERTYQGDYQLCFDNTFSKMKAKTLFFTLLISSANDAAEDERKASNDTLEVKLQDFKTRLDMLHRQIQRSRVIQLMLRTFDTKDQLLQDDNLSMVNFWSCFSMVLVLVVAFSQVRILESLFPES
ncbi:transmembrane emp24 domain-containing protein 1-like [Hippocampus zosterae]|uniref:transmembrane emp24 domain-containing protein 1-like n=1 Tax=Hippocampus zosterae TaxID=109293 RepID=UPI00223DD2F6|nr:transmembrane emp24 domain-containing protein 1-like [Hippocampus zosterae]